MSTGSTIDAPEAPSPVTLSPLQRIVAIYTRPAHAWDGLRERAQWFIPMLIMLVAGLISAAILHQRAFVPMMMDNLEQQVANGQMPAERLTAMEQFFGGPMGLLFSLVQQLIAVPVTALVSALIVWFGTGFVLGARMKYRQALEVSAWSSLVTLPTYVLFTILAWVQQSYKSVHVGFGALLADPENPSRLQNALVFLLDWIGPLSIWYVVVMILGAAALSGAPRKSVAWVLATLYVVLGVLFAGLTSLAAPAS